MPHDSWAQCAELLADAFAADDDVLTSTGSACQGGLQSKPALSLGIGRQADALLSGGLQAGDVTEVFGPPGVGKTQLGLCVAVHAASQGHRVTYITAKDAPIDLAHRLLIIAQGQGRPLKAALANIRLVFAPDFSEFARIAAAQGQTRDKDETINLADVFIIDGLSMLLAPFVSAQSVGAKWRLSWTWRVLRYMATRADTCILLLSTTVASSFNGGRVKTDRAARTGLALGQMWSTAASTRLQLEDIDTGGSDAAQRGLRFTLQKNVRGPTGEAVQLVLNEAGVCSCQL